MCIYQHAYRYIEEYTFTYVYIYAWTCIHELIYMYTKEHIYTYRRKQECSYESWSYSYEQYESCAYSSMSAIVVSSYPTCVTCLVRVESNESYPYSFIRFRLVFIRAMLHTCDVRIRIWGVWMNTGMVRMNGFELYAPYSYSFIRVILVFSHCTCGRWLVWIRRIRAILVFIHTRHTRILTSHMCDMARMNTSHAS